MNLHDELQSLYNEAPNKTQIIYDLGCGDGNSTQELQEIFPDFKLVGINSQELAPKEGQEVNVPIFIGYGHDLNTELKDKLEREGLWPPNVILIRNTIHYPAQEKTMVKFLDAIYEALPWEGFALVNNCFDNKDDTGRDVFTQAQKVECRDTLYQQVRDANSAREHLFVIDTLESENGETYLKLYKANA